MRVFIPLNIFLLCLLSGTPAAAQTCDCDDTPNCPAAFGANFTGQICYDIADAVNNDLADPNQGICGVNITFTHQHIWDLELTLISPSGQSVPLVGFNTNFFGTTNSVLWNVLFIPCANIPSPDTINGNPFQPVWTNNQSWPFAAIFDGSYHPVSGNCLESFNSGPVNGTWCLQIDNQPSPYTGQILNFEVILCDNSGLLCCDADAGELVVADFAVCQGDSSLLIEWEPDYGPIYPSPSEYGYSFVVSDTSGTILLIEPVADLTGFAPGSYSVCGLSYLLADSLNIPEPDGALTLGDLQNNLSGAAPWFCGDLTPSCVGVDIVAPPAPVFLAEIICSDETYTVGDSTVNTTGQYTFNLVNAFQCDSIVHLDLTVLPVDSTFLTETVCFAGSFQVGDSLYSASGNYTTLLDNMMGCDSLVFLDLTVLGEIETFLADTICQGDSYAVGGSLFDATGNYSVLLQSFQGCDSTVYLDLTVLNPVAAIALPDTITCSVSQVILDGSGSGSGLSFQWTALTGSLAPPLNASQATALGPGFYELMVEEYFCQARDTVEVIADTVPPAAMLLPADTLTCSVDSVLLDGSASGAGAAIVYEWLGPSGAIIPGANGNTLWATQPGAYSLVVLNSENGCADTSALVVAGDFQAPFVEAGPGSILNCQVLLAQLDGSATYQDGGFFFEWQGPGGPIPWVDSLQAETSVPGTFFLTATDPGNGCSAVDSVIVAQDIAVPAAEAGPSDTLNCNFPELNLSGSGASNSGLVEYSWTTVDGNLVGDTTIPGPLVDAPGMYVLTVTDPVNFCLATDSVQVAEDMEFPVAEAGPSVTLTCVLPSWSLGDPDNTSLGPEFAYLWIGPAGDTISTTLSPEIFAGGLYQLFVTNTLNGCTSGDSVVIGQEGNIPIAVAGPGGTLTCSDPLILLDGSNSSAGPLIEYTWLDESGNIIGQTNQLSVGNAGVYCLVVEDGFSLCADTACVEVFQGAGFPQVNAGPNESLDCFSGQTLLQGSVQPVLPDYVLSWNTVSGNILTNPSLPVITVDEPGWYIFSVEDTLNDCTVIDSAFVTLDTAACMPLANAGADGLINCYNVPFDTLDASQGTSAGLNITYQWLPVNGNGSVFSGENTLFPTVTDGVFVLIVTNTSVGLIATDTVVVPQDLNLPVANAGPDQTLDCATISSDFYLDGSGSSQGSNFVYQWSTNGGLIVSGANTLTPLITAPGLYDLEVTDTLNGCTVTDAVLIELDGDLPTPCIEPVIQIPCGDPTIVIGDTCAAATPYAYQWFVSGGVIVSDPTDSMVELLWTDSVVVLSGLVTDTTNMCPVAVEMELFAPSACFPECDIAVPDTLTCDVTLLSLDASGSSVGQEFTYFWEAISGSLCGGETTMFPCVDASGVYRLTVTDTTTQFTCTEDVVVLENTAPPPVDAGPDAYFTCDTQQASLQAVTQSWLSYQWTSGQGPGCFLSGDQTPGPLVSCPGVYYLEVTSALNGCSAIDSAMVLYDTIPPVASIQVAGLLTCQDTTALISSQGSTIGPDITYQWTLDGVVVATGLPNWTAEVPGEYCLTLTNELTGCFSQVCDTVFQINDPPLVNAGPDTMLTCSVTAITLSGAPAPGASMSVLWSTPGGCLQSDPALADVLIDCAGLYVFEVTDGVTGCSASDSLVVTVEIDPPVAVIQPADPVLTCYQPMVELDGSGSIPSGELIFSWATDGSISGPADEETAMAAAPGVYQLLVENINTHCKDSTFVIVDDGRIYPVAHAGPDSALTCYHAAIQLDGSASSQGTDFIYEWIPPTGVVIPSGGNSLFPLVDEAGIYALVVQDTTNGCSSSDTVQVGINTVAPQALIDHPLPLLITCAQEEVPLSGLLSQPAGQLGYTWFSIGGQIQGDLSGVDVEALSPGTYYLEVQDLVNGCLDTASVLVDINQDPPDIQLGVPDTLTCIQSSVVLDASGTSAGGPMGILWTGPGPISDDTILSPEVTGAGVYVLEVTDLDNGCTAKDSLVILQDTLAPQAQAVAGGGFDCETMEVELSGAGSSVGPVFEYSWMSLAGDPVQDPATLTPTVFVPGWYELTVTNVQNGCTATAQVEVVAQAFPITGIGLEIVPPGCFGDLDGSIQVDTLIGGVGPYLFSFDSSAFYPHSQFHYLPAGNYLLSVEDANGCRLDTLVYIPNPNLPLVDLGPDQYIQLGQTVTVEAIPNIPDSVLSEVLWVPYSDPGCPDCLVFQTSPPYTTTFVVRIRDASGCLASDEMTVFVEKESYLYMPTAFSPNGDGENDIIFPQTGPEVIEVELFQIFDRWGDLVYEARGFLPNDPAYGWNGSFGDRPMNAQVLVWQAKVRLRDGSVHWFEGGLTLAR